MTNENFRRELGSAFDEMAGSPSSALPDRVRSSLANAPEQRGPYWIAGVAAAVIAVVIIGVLFVANPLNHRPANTVPGAGSSPTPSAPATQDPNLPTFVCSASTQSFDGGNPPGPPQVLYVDGVLTGTHAGYDRITIEFKNSYSASIDVIPQGTATFTQGASGQSVTLGGSAGLLVTIKGADEHTNYSGPTDFKTGYAGLVEARQVQDFEGTVQWALGLSKPGCYRAFFLSSPTRLVIDVQTRA